MTITTDLLRLRAENEALKQSLQHESDVVESAKEEIIRQRVENANQSEKINALIAENEALQRNHDRYCAAMGFGYTDGITGRECARDIRAAMEADK